MGWGGAVGVGQRVQDHRGREWRREIRPLLSRFPAWGDFFLPSHDDLTYSIPLVSHLARLRVDTLKLLAIILERYGEG